ncbi:hypothetical protein [Streptococcus pneumoniae]
MNKRIVMLSLQHLTLLIMPVVYESAEKPQPAKPAPQNTVLPKPTYQPAF